MQDSSDSGAPKKRRLSLTKTQLQTAAGADLLALCQTVTEDGSLSEEELAQIRSWLEEHRASDLPAKDFLITIVEKIISDGKITDEERRELYRAIEIVLPPEARKEAAEKRKAIEGEEKARTRSEVDAGKALEREERERNKAVRSANFMVAGTRYEGRSDIIEEYAEAGDRVLLIRDRANEHSRNAIEVRLENGFQIGFVPEEYASDLARFLDQGSLHRAFITKILTGGRSPIPVVQAYLYSSNATINDAISEAQAMQKKADSPSALRGCLYSLAIGVAIMLLLFVLCAVIK